MGKRKENPFSSAPSPPGSGKVRPPLSSPLLLSGDHVVAGRTYGTSTPRQPRVWGADGPLLPGGAGRIPAEVWRAGAGQGCSIGSRDPAERGEMKGNPVRIGRGASVRVTGFVGLSVQQGDPDRKSVV